MAVNQIKVIILLVVLQLNLLLGQKEPHFVGNRTTIVHLFEWNWLDIAKECENFLGPQGYAGVQISPPSEHLIIPNRPWWERYQVVSYKLKSRSGDEVELREMVERCNAVGVRIYADVILNHMTDDNGTGTAGSRGSYDNMSYPAVPYGPLDFRPPCDLKNYFNVSEVRNCQLMGLLDLNQSKPNVRQTLADYMNKLIDMGVAGFRIDGAKHMWPEDLYAIFSKLHSLKTSSQYNFPPCARPYIYHEVIDMANGEPIKAYDYVLIGDVTEFKVSNELGLAFRGKTKLMWLRVWGVQSGMLASHNALVFIDNHGVQRLHADGTGTALSYKNGEQYKMALIFMLAHPYGKVTRIMSSFSFDDIDEGPPMNANGTKNKSPTFLRNGQCDTISGWICEHRWKEVFKMVQFRNIVGADADLNSWWDNGGNQIAFGRGEIGFIAINMESENEMKVTLKTKLPAGEYCDIIYGAILADNGIDRMCTGQQFDVDKLGRMVVKLRRGPSAMAIHVGATVHNA